MSDVVVGVDGSPGSIAAIVWAIGEAELRKVNVRAVIAWEYPYAYGGLTTSVLTQESNDELEKNAFAELEAAINAAVGKLTKQEGNAVQIESVAIAGNPSSVMERESFTADLVVVGAKGHSSLSKLLLGSTSDYLAKHSGCPMVIVHERKPHSDGKENV